MKIKRILISQPKPASDKSPYYEIAEKYKVEFVFHPFIKVEGISAKEFRTQKVNILDHTAILLTSRHAVDNFFLLCAELRVVIPETMKYFCVTEVIALYMQKYIQYRKRKIFFGTTGKVEDLIPAILKHKTESYFVPVSDANNDEIGKLLSKNKINYQAAMMYRTVSNDFEEGEKLNYDMLVFFSPVGVATLINNFPDFKQNDIKIGCLGKVTAKAVVDSGLRLDLEAPTPESPSITAAIDRFLKDNK